MTATVFVGGPRHGAMIPGQPRAGEQYRCLDTGDVYTAVEVRLTLADPLGRPGPSYVAHAYASDQVNPDKSPHARELFGQGLADAVIRWYVRENGAPDLKGILAEGKVSNTAYVAWCDACGRNGRIRETFDDQRERAEWIRDHQATTGHVARWANEEG